MKRTGTPTFVLRLPLVVQPGEDRILIGRMEAGRRLYNATLDEALRRHGCYSSLPLKPYKSCTSFLNPPIQKLAAHTNYSNGMDAHFP